MSTIGDLVTIGVVGFVGYKLLVGNTTPSPSRQTTINGVELPKVINPNPSKPMDTPIITPDKPLETKTMEVRELEIKNNPEEKTSDIKADLTVDINTHNNIESKEYLDDGTLLVTDVDVGTWVAGPIEPTKPSLETIGKGINDVAGFFGGIADFFGGIFDPNRRLFSNLKP